MDGALYALIGNTAIAALFALTFAIVRISYPDQRDVLWFCAVYVVGMLAPLGELGVRLTAWTVPFMMLSYGSFLLCLSIMPLALAAVAGRRRPWLAAASIVLLGLAIRALVWNGPRNVLWYEMTYQAPFAAASALSAIVAHRIARDTGGRLWRGLSGVLAVLGLHFVAKPFFAVAFGSGHTPRDYAASAYALFSQATGGILIVTAGLLVLLLVMQKATGHRLAESETDPLTGLVNRRGFERRAGALLTQAARDGHPLSAILFDLDHFKRVNDGYGHATGDAVLRAFAALLNGHVPPGAVVARLGGEEFAVLLGRTTTRGAWLAAQAVRDAMPTIGAHLPPVTISGGLAGLVPGDTLATLLARADAETYAAKRAGRDRICPTPEAIEHGARLSPLHGG